MPPRPSQRRRRKFLLTVVVLLCGLVLYVRSIHDFLAISRPVHGEVLVVEGWFSELDMTCMEDAAKAVRTGHYRRVVCVATEPLKPAVPGLVPDARHAADRLIALGVDERLIQVLAVPDLGHDRTYNCALAVRAWLQQEQPAARDIDVFTIGIHARKSQVLYQKALPPDIRVGIIAGTETTYPVSRWWFSRRGIYLMERNTLGWLHALAYHPAPPAPAEAAGAHP